MSEPTDQKPSDPMDDESLSALYARGSTEQPSHELDQAILDKARKATSQQSTRTKDYSSWSQAVSVAAVLVVSVTLVMLVREEAPEPSSLSSQPADVQEEIDFNKPAKRMLEKQKAEAPLAENRAAPKAFMDSLSVKKRMKEEEIIEKKKEEIKKAKAQRQRSEKERALDKRIAASPAPVLQQKTFQQKAPAQETIPQESLSAGTMASGFVGGNVEGLAADDKSCNQLTEQECFTSAACTLTKIKAEDGYLCRPAKDHCELLFRQSGGTREICEARAGCVFVPANCYCPPGVKCECAGGEPAQCQSRKN